MQSKLLTVKDLRTRLNCATSTIYRWMENGHFPRPIRLCGMVRWEEEDVNAFLEAAKMRRTKYGMRPEGVRRPGRPEAYPRPPFRAKPKR